MGDMIITGGENVWPVMVERILSMAPGVSDCAVVGRPDPEWGESVVAVVVPSSDAPTLEELRDLVKSFGIVEINPEELDNYFPEFLALKSNCKFNNCMHVKEPNCAIKLGLEEKIISKTRYDSYIDLIKEDDYKIR